MLLSPFLQYNGPHGIYNADYRSVAVDGGGRQTSYQLGMAGAIAYVGGTLGLSRPINDSFGVVQVGGLQDVRVYQNNQVIGRTGPAGTISSYPTSDPIRRIRLPSKTRMSPSNTRSLRRSCLFPRPCAAVR